MNLEPGFNAHTSGSEGNSGSTENLYCKAINSEIKDQFMVGDALLVAPLFAGQTSRTVILPNGKWYDFYTGKYVGESELITVKPGLDIIPVFVKDGGIIPMMPIESQIKDSKSPVEIRFYGNKESEYQLYDDDGVSYNYEKGAFTRIQLRVAKDKKGNLKGSVNLPEGSPLYSFSTFTWKFMTQ
jgi:alpha-D-xyloside xylohydrolase